MNIFLEIIEGSEKGQKFKLSEGLQIGRTQGTVRLTDPKVSGLHAEVVLDSNGQLILIDKQSFNGLIIGGKKVSKIILMPGVKFQIGKTTFKVRNSKKSSSIEEQENENWLQTISKIQDLIPVNVNKIVSKPFIIPIELHFLEGIQAGTILTLGYGPRVVGFLNLDIELKEIHSPEDSFILTPEDSNVTFKTKYQEDVKINGLSLDSKIIESGDRISIYNTVIQVRFKL